MDEPSGKAERMVKGCFTHEFLPLAALDVLA